MAIIWKEVEKSFILQSKSSTYIIRITKDKYLEHVYYGAKIEAPVVSALCKGAGRSSFHANPGEDNTFSLDTMPAEYPAYGNTDLRMPAYQLQLENGTRITELVYSSYEIVRGKQKLNGLPSLSAAETEAETLSIILLDKLIGLKVILSYTVFLKEDVIVRSTSFHNEGNTKLRLFRALSMSIDFDHHEYDLLTLSGSWARERYMVRRPLVFGSQSIESRRGASGHSENPFIALMEKKATENSGEVFGFNLIYSGNFYAGAEVDQYSATRVAIGINSFDFSWTLQPGDQFITPEAVMVYSRQGLGAMSRTYHRLYRKHLMKSRWRNIERPVVINNWEVTYFNFNEEKIIDLAKKASGLGIEMLVLDDGWFGKRDSDNCSLGDWIEDARKLPNGLKGLSEAVEANGMHFGLWFEPEMVSPDSDLYRAHPDWCLHVPDRHRSTGRKQLILDYSREDVREEIIRMLSEILGKAKISYVKWDMNRNMSEIGSALLPAELQQETAHRYILGVYQVMDIITDRFPEILFESCSGGGGRFDPGMLYYMPQTWTSDDTDALERLKIQYGTSVVYPVCAMTAHVSASPNHQTGKSSSIAFRHAVAMAGNFGYELDVTGIASEEQRYLQEQIAFYKSIRRIVQFGELYRLQSPFEGENTSFLYVTEDKSQAVLFLYCERPTPNSPLLRVRLDGLDPSKSYRIEQSNLMLSGDQLMNYGINEPSEMAWGEGTSAVIRLDAV